MDADSLSGAVVAADAMAGAVAVRSVSVAPITASTLAPGTLSTSAPSVRRLRTDPDPISGRIGPTAPRPEGFFGPPTTLSRPGPDRRVTGD